MRLAKFSFFIFQERTMFKVLGTVLLTRFGIKFLDLEIQHLNPVRGHSYCQCDRNFGLYEKMKILTEVIESDSEYNEMIRNARRNPKPFNVVKSENYVVKNFEDKIKNSYKKDKNLLTSKSVKLVYYPNGEILLYSSYSREPKKFKIQRDTTFQDLENAPEREMIRIMAEKVRDLRHLRWLERLVSYEVRAPWWLMLHVCSLLLIFLIIICIIVTSE